MKLVGLILLGILVLPACHKDKNKNVTIHCEGLITDASGTGDNGRLYMPSAFTPNGDGINDIARPLGQNIAAIEFTIFDENSNIVFTTSTLGQGWSTTVSSNSAVRYYYRIMATTNAGHKIGLCGDLYKLSCFPAIVPRSQLYFEDQLTPSGFTGITHESMGICP